MRLKDIEEALEVNKQITIELAKRTPDLKIIRSKNKRVTALLAYEKPIIKS